jgi:hypothetical protein
MEHMRDDDALPEPTEKDYLEGVIIAIILFLVVIFELYLKALLSAPVRDKSEVCIIFLAIGMIHLLGPHLLAFLYNCKHLILLRFLGVCKGQAQPRHARVVGAAFLLAGIVRWFM